MGFAFSPLANTRLSLTAASTSSVALPSIGRNVRVVNAGPSDCYVKLTSTFTSGTINTYLVMARTVELFDRQTNTVLTGIGSGGSTKLDITTGDGGM